MTIDQKLDLRCILTAPIAGGVIIGSSSTNIYSPLAALFLGVIAAVTQYFFNKVEVIIGLRPYWSNGVLFLFAVQGFIGGILSSIFRAINKTSGNFGTLYNSLTGNL